MRKMENRHEEEGEEENKIEKEEDTRSAKLKIVSFALLL